MRHTLRLLSALVLLHAPALAQCELTKLTSTDPVVFAPTFDREFGAALAISGDRLAVGAGAHQAVYVYERHGLNWLRTATIPAPSADASFGRMLDLDGDTLVVAGSHPNVTVFREVAGAWTVEGTLLPPSPPHIVDYPTSLALDGDRVVVGDDEMLSTDGRAFVFERGPSGWAWSKTLFPSDALIDRFGNAVAISGDTILVSADNQDFAYVFDHDGSTWTETAMLPGHATAVAIEGDLAVTGNSADNTHGVGAGAARVYERVAGVWQPAGFLTASDAGVLHHFGFSVDVRAGLIVVGAPFWNAPSSSNDGSAYAFRKVGGTWQEIGHLVPPGRGANDNIGRDVATDGSLAALSAPKDDDEGADRGAVYVMSPEGDPCATLQHFPGALSVSSGGTQTMLLRAPFSEGNKTYVVAGTWSGANAGFFLGGSFVPLTPDAWFLFTLTHANLGLLTNTFGTLDAVGDANASLTIPAGTNPNLAGRRMHHAFLTFDFAPLTLRHVSNAIQLRLNP